MAATGIMAELFGFYNTIFQPILSLGPYTSLAFFSLVLAVLYTAIYWVLMDLERADEIKEKLNKHQEKMQEADDDEVGDHMQEALRLNSQFMKLNMKPMLATMAFVLLIFPWLGATYAPTIDMNQTAPNTYTGQFEWNGHQHPIKVVNDTEYTVKYRNQSVPVGGMLKAYGVSWEVSDFAVKNEAPALKLNAAFVKMPFSLPLVGNTLNWLAFYILIVMPVGYVLRKAAGIA
ncbi:MAG: EMC3/TMCO1 family protein [Candidatus Nanohaloarchaea archaeon]